MRNNLEKQEKRVLDELAKMGICSISHDAFRRIASRQRITAHEFAIEILRAEGFPIPNHEPRLIRLLTNWFKARFGNDVGHDPRRAFQLRHQSNESRN